jgi:hypothetical protein
MTLGSTHPLTEMSTRNIFWGVKAAGAYGWQTYHLHVPIVVKSGSVNLLEPSGPVQACTGIAFYILYKLKSQDKESDHLPEFEIVALRSHCLQSFVLKTFDIVIVIKSSSAMLSWPTVDMYKL